MAENWEIKGFDELLRALDEAPQVARPIFEGAMNKSLLLIRDTVKPYPPQPSRTRAKTFNTYVRGTGHYPRSAFGQRGSYNPRSATRARRSGKVRLTSERLGTKWAQEIEYGDDHVDGIIGNTASYAREVQGEYQPPFHALTGWITLYDGVQQVEEKVYAAFEAAVGELTQALEQRP